LNPLTPRHDSPIGTHSGVVLATIHVRAGEPGGLALAHGAITAVAKLSSGRVRKRLLLLADALAARHRRERPVPDGLSGRRRPGLNGSPASPITAPMSRTVKLAS
jgi:hypothetical protein